MKKDPYSAFIDIGSQHIVCLITLPRQEEDRLIAIENSANRVLALVIVDAQGIENGVVRHHRQACQALRKAVQMAEKQSGIHIKKARLMSSGNAPQSMASETALGLAGKPINPKHLQQLYRNAKNIALPRARHIIDISLLGFSIDDDLIDQDPIGQTGHKVNLALRLIHVDRAAIRNNVLIARKNGIKVMSYHYSPVCFAPFCVGLRKDKPVTVVVDLGADNTAVAVFLNEVAIDVASFNVGGNRITADIAEQLSLEYIQAESVKKEYSFAVSKPQDGAAPKEGGLQGQMALRASLPKIITPRIKEIFYLIKAFLMRSRATHHGDYSVVLCGGGSMLPGVSSVATQILGRSVFPLRTPSLPWVSGQWHSALYAGVLGLSHLAVKRQAERLPGNHIFGNILAPFLHRRHFSIENRG